MHGEFFEAPWPLTNFLKMPDFAWSAGKPRNIKSFENDKHTTNLGRWLVSKNVKEMYPDELTSKCP